MQHIFIFLQFLFKKHLLLKFKPLFTYKCNLKLYIYLYNYKQFHFYL